MSKNRETQRVALQGSMKAVTRIEAKGEPKIGVDEFMALAKRFGFSPAALKKIRAAASADDLGEGPFLANYYSQLKETCVQAFERLSRETFDSPHSLATSSGTGALHSAFAAAGVEAGTEVICSSIGFFATAAAIDVCGGTPVFCDVDESLHMDPAKIEKLITKRTVAISPTHIMGSVANMPAIMKIARKHKLKVVEDCAQSCGGTVKGKFVGTFGDLGCFSISAYKIVGGGEGGLVLAKTKRLWERANNVAESGGLWRPDRFAPPRYPGELFTGTNYRMSEIEAAVDVVQLSKMPKVVKRFRTVNARIRRRLKSYAEITPQVRNDSAGEIGYMLRFFPETIELGEKIVAALRDQKVDASFRGGKGAPDWHIYSHMYAITHKHGYEPGLCPVADDLYERMVTIGVNQWLSASDCRELGDRINAALAEHCTPAADGRSWE